MEENLEQEENLLEVNPPVTTEEEEVAVEEPIDPNSVVEDTNEGDTETDEEFEKKLKEKEEKAKLTFEQQRPGGPEAEGELTGGVLEEVELKPEEEKKPKIQVEQVNFLENFYKKYPQYKGYKSDADMITAITNKFPQYKDVVIKFEEEKKKEETSNSPLLSIFQKKNLELPSSLAELKTSLDTKEEEGEVNNPDWTIKYEELTGSPFNPKTTSSQITTIINNQDPNKWQEVYQEIFNVNPATQKIDKGQGIVDIEEHFKKENEKLLENLEGYRNRPKFDFTLPETTAVTTGRLLENLNRPKNIITNIPDQIQKTLTNITDEKKRDIRKDIAFESDDDDEGRLDTEQNLKDELERILNSNLILSKEAPKKTGSTILDIMFSRDEPETIIGDGNTNLIPILNYNFEKFGFNVKDTSFNVGNMPRDAIVISSSKEGVEPLTIRTDKGLSEKQQVEEAQKLIDYIKLNAVFDLDLLKLESKYDNSLQTILNDEDRDERLFEMNRKSNDLKNKINDYLRLQNEVNSGMTIVSNYNENELRDPNNLPFIIEVFTKEQDLRKRKSNLKEEFITLEQEAIILNDMVGDYTLMKGEQGTFGGTIFTSILNGISKVTAGATSLFLDLTSPIIDKTKDPKEYMSTYITLARKKYNIEIPRYIEQIVERGDRSSEIPTGFEVSIKSIIPFDIRNKIEKDIQDLNTKNRKGDAKVEFISGDGAYYDIILNGKPYAATDEAFRDYAENNLPLFKDLKNIRLKEKGGFLDFIRNSLLDTYDVNSKEYMERMQNEDWWESTVGMAFESLPAMLGKNWLQRTFNLYSLVRNQFDEEMAGMDLTETEKNIFITPVGITIAVLERFGFRNAINNKAVLTGFITQVLKKQKPGVTLNAKTWRELVINNLDNPILKFGALAGASTLAEAETELAQYATETGVKILFKELNDRFDFETPESFMEFMITSLDMSARGAVGGFMFGTIPAISGAFAKGDFGGLSRVEFEAFVNMIKDDKTLMDYKNFFIQKTKQDIIEGKTTKEKAEQDIRNFERAAGLYNQIPINLPIKDKIDLMTLLVQKEKLELTKVGKDPSLTGPIDEDIKEINDRIKDIVGRKRKKDTTFEPFTAEEVQETLNETQPRRTESNVDLDGDNITIVNTVGDGVKGKGRQEGDSGKVFVLEDENVSPEQKKEPRRQQLLDNGRTIIQAVSKLFPNLNIIFAESTEKFRLLAPNIDRRALAVNMGKNNAIVINLETATLGALAHEIGHEISKRFPRNIRNEFNIELGRIISKSLGLDNSTESLKIKEQIDRYMSLWENAPDNIKKEEYVAEILGIISRNFTGLPTQTKSKIRIALETFLEKIGLGSLISGLTKTENDVIQAINNISRDLTLGQEISPDDITVLDVNTIKSKPTTKTETDGDKTQLDIFKESEKKKPTPTTPKRSIEDVLRLTPMSGGKFVDGNRNTRQSLENAIRGTGYEVRQARNGNYYFVNKETGKIYDNRKGKDQTRIETKEEQEQRINDEVSRLVNSGYTVGQAIETLKKRGFTKTQIDKAIESIIPPNFKSINKGEALYKRVINFALNRIEQNKNRRKKKTGGQIMDDVIEYLEKQQVFKDQSRTYKVGGKTVVAQGYSETQAGLITDIQQTLGLQPKLTIDKINDARSQLRYSRRGRVSLTEVKKGLVRLIRETLPADLFTRAEVISLMGKISMANANNINTISAEVIEFITQKNSEYFQSKIDSILDGKYKEKNSAGVVIGTTVDNETRKAIEQIKKDTQFDDPSAENIDKRNTKLSEEKQKILNKQKPGTTLSNKDILRLKAIDIAIGLNNAKLNPTTDPATAVQLNDSGIQLLELQNLGIQNFKEQLELKKEQKLQLAEKFLEGISLKYRGIRLSKKGAEEQLKAEGIKNPTADQIAQRQKENLEKADKINSELQVDIKKRNEKNTINGIKNFFRYWGNFLFAKHESTKGLIDIVIEYAENTTGKSVEQLVILDRLYPAEEKFKELMLKDQATIMDKIKELYGIKKGLRENAKTKAKIKGWNKVIITNLKDKNGNPIRITPNQIAYLYQQFQDPSTHNNFKATFGDNFKNTIDELTKLMPKELKEFADWQMNEFYPELYERYNEVYKEVYGTDMPLGKNYGGRLYTDQTKNEPVNVLDSTDGESYTNNVTANSQKARTENANPISYNQGSTNVLENYLDEMNYFTSMRIPLQEIMEVLKDDQVKNAIVSTKGQTVYDLLINSFNVFNDRNRVAEEKARAINRFQTAFVTGSLGANPSIAIKQLTSIPAYSAEIGYANYLANIPNPSKAVKLLKEISENSTFLKYRYKEGIAGQVAELNKQNANLFADNPMRKLINLSLSFIKLGDAGAIYIGGLANYNYYKKQALAKGMTEQEAIKEAVRLFENDTKEAQQASDFSQKDAFQTQPTLRFLNQFYTAPRQYYRKIMRGARNLRRKISRLDSQAGKDDIVKNINYMTMYGVILPATFAYVSLAAPGLMRDRREEDDEEMIRNTLVNMLGNLFIVGQAITSVNNITADKPWAREAVKEIGFLDIVSGAADKLNRALKEKNEEKQYELFVDGIMEVLKLSGIPAPQMKRYKENIEKVLNRDTQDGLEDALRILNFSDYTITGPQKNTKVPKRDVKFENPVQEKIKKKIENMNPNRNNNRSSNRKSNRSSNRK